MPASCHRARFPAGTVEALALTLPEPFTPSDAASGSLSFYPEWREGFKSAGRTVAGSDQIPVPLANCVLPTLRELVHRGPRDPKAEWWTERIRGVLDRNAPWERAADDATATALHRQQREREARLQQQWEAILNGR